MHWTTLRCTACELVFLLTLNSVVPEVVRLTVTECSRHRTDEPRTTVRRFVLFAESIRNPDDRRRLDGEQRAETTKLSVALPWPDQLPSRLRLEDQVCFCSLDSLAA